jgi:hypothetical protein
LIQVEHQDTSFWIIIDESKICSGYKPTKKKHVVILKSGGFDWIFARIKD